MSRTAKVIVEAQNKTGAGIKAAAQTINGFGRDVQKVGNLISKAFVVTAAVGFAKQLASVAADMESAWATQERALLGFEAAMRGAAQISASGVSSLKAFSQTMASLVGVDDQVILSFETLLATSGRTEEQIRAIITAAADMSAATGKDLKTSVEQLNKTFGGTAGELAEILPELKNFTKEQFLAGDAVALVAEQYEGMAASLSGSAQVSIDNYNNAVGDLTESLGALVSEGMTPLRSWLTDLTRQWASAIDVARSYAKVQKAIADKDAGALVLLSDSDLKAATAKQEEIARGMYDAIVKGASYNMGGGLEVKGPMLKGAYNAQTDQLQAMRLEADRRASAAPASAAAATSITGKKKSDEENAWDAFIEANRVGARPVDSGIGDDPEIAALLESFTMSSDERILRANEALIQGMQNNPASVSEGGSIFGGADMGPLALLGDTFGEILGPLSQFQALMDPLGTIFSGMMEVLGPLIDSLLTPLVGILKIVGQTIGKILAPALELLAPIITKFSELFVFMFNYVVVPVYNAVRWVFNKITNGFIAFANGILAIIDAIPFVNVGRISYVADDNGFLDKISLDDVNAAGAASSSGSSGSGASYSGSQSITFNFYNQGNVVGSGGLEELALLIQSILQRNARYA